MQSSPTCTSPAVTFQAAQCAAAAGVTATAVGVSGGGVTATVSRAAFQRPRPDAHKVTSDLANSDYHDQKSQANRPVVLERALEEQTNKSIRIINPSNHRFVGDGVDDALWRGVGNFFVVRKHFGGGKYFELS